MVPFLIGLLLLWGLWVQPASAAENPPTLNSEISVPGVSPSTAGGLDYFELERKKIIRWNDQTKYIMVYIADGSYLPGWNPENPERVKMAFYEWEQVMAPRFHFIFMPDERGSDVKVQWAAKIGTEQVDEAAGINEFQTWGKFICKDDIKLALLNRNGRLVTPNVIQSVSLHEIGHMLGLKVHSDSRQDVMYPSTTVSDWSDVQHLSQRDINTMRLVYASKPDYSNPEGYHLVNFEKFKKTQHGHRMTMLWIPVPGVPFPVPIILPF